jgi:hypothetical protein
MHTWHHVTNHLIISNDKDVNSENRIKLCVRDTHDSWEPLTHINTNDKVKEFYQTNPAAIRISHKTPLPITIRSVCIMSTISSPLNASLTSSPNPLTLSECIDNPPSPLSLEERLEYPPQNEDPNPVNLGVEVMMATAYQEIYDRLGTPDPEPAPSLSGAPPPTSPHSLLIGHLSLLPHSPTTPYPLHHHLAPLSCATSLLNTITTLRKTSAPCPVT